MFGWICPRCQLVHSPYIEECFCSPPAKIEGFAINSTTTMCNCQGQPNTAGICLLCGLPKFIQGYTFYV